MAGLETRRHHERPAAEPVHEPAVASAPAEPAYISLLGEEPDDAVDTHATAAAHDHAAADAAGVPTYEIPADDSAVGAGVTTYEIPSDDTAASAGVTTYEIPSDEDEARTYEIPADDAEAAPAVVPGAGRTYAIDESDDDLVYEIPEADAEPAGSGSAAAPAFAPAGDAAPQGDASGVYEIEDSNTIEAVAQAGDEPEPAGARVYDLESTTAADGAEAAPAAEAPGAEEHALAQVEELLVHAQHQFRNGDRDEASMTLAQAAQVCETIGRLDNAASIYRSLGRGPHATPSMLEMWLGNCERRGDAAEAGQVACELGDRALNDGDEPAARGWFERALAYDPGNETALRRKHRLEQAGGAGAIIADEPAIPPVVRVPEPAPVEGRVEVAVGRAQAVSFDLAGLLAEFQRGVEAQLAGDAQSHYDLGMTYREMGLLEQAMDSFRCAAQDQAFAARALEMVGRCMSEQGRLPEAADEFKRALAIPGVTADNDGELRYYYGLALAGTGRMAEALAELEAVQERLPGFEDVDQLVADLRGQLGRAA
jgi:tetratricopeptide (TPR) repeat protein